MGPILNAQDFWPLWGIILGGAALCIYLEQNYQWAARTSGPVLAIVGAMLLSNFKVMPTESSTYDVVDGYLVKIAIPLLLFRANVVRIFRESKSMFLAFHIASVGTILGAFVAAIIFRSSVDRVAEVAGIMTGSYIGGAVNFVAIQNHFQVSSASANPLIVADNFIMAGMFGLLFVIAGSKFFRRHYPHPHSLEADKQESQVLAAKHWERKGISLLDIAKSLAIAFAITAVSIKLAEAIKTHTESIVIQSIFGSAFVMITFITVALTTLFHRHLDRINGPEELGTFFLYLFFFVIGLRADFVAVVKNVPFLFLFCLVMAMTNLIVTLSVGKLLRLNLEELLLSVNATLGGAPSAVAMAIATGWSRLVLPGLLAAIWGYVIGTLVGIVVAEALKRFFGLP
jgi:uncharacterized membrane protein